MADGFGDKRTDHKAYPLIGVLPAGPRMVGRPSDWRAGGPIPCERETLRSPSPVLLRTCAQKRAKG